MGDTITELAEIQGQIADLRALAKTSSIDDAEAINWMADELEARARELDRTAC